jgi:hypothetical protein
MSFLPAFTLAFPTPLSSGATAPVSVSTLHQFSAGTWIENLAVRPSGAILTVGYSPNNQANIYSVFPTAKSAEVLVHTFPGINGVTGITASPEPDIYFVMTGALNFSIFSATPGTAAIHRLAFDACDRPIVKELAALPEIIMPNGMLSIPNTPYILIADSINGKVWRFNTLTHNLTVYLDDPLLLPSGTSAQAGVNGIKFSHGFFYFSNTNQALIARVPVSGPNATPQGTPQIVATQTLADDFIVNRVNGGLFIAENGGNVLSFVKGEGNNTVVEKIAEMAGPTAVIWVPGQEGRRLFVSTDGGVAGYIIGNYTIGGTISVVDVERI